MDKVKRPDVPGLILGGSIIAALMLTNWYFRVDQYRFLYDIGEIVVSITALHQTPLIMLSRRDDLLMAAVLLFGKLLLPVIYVPGIYMPRTIPFTLLLLLTLVFIVRVVHGNRSGYGCVVVFSGGVCLLISWLFNRGEQFVYDLHPRLEQDLALLVALVYILTAPILAWCISRTVSRLTGASLAQLEAFSRKYKEIDRSALMVAVLTLICMILTEMLPFSEHLSKNALPLLWISLCAIVGVIQLVYIRVLVKSISLKEEMRLQESDRESLSRYNRELESNMESLRDVRHDIKNLFLTMGAFVEKSGDAQMQAFYQENIVPFADQELLKSDYLTKLTLVRDESLRSFLYYKIMQGIERSISIDLELQLCGDCNFGIAQADLIRIMGILIDNAIEEAESCEGVVSIHIKEDPDEYIFSVRNPIRPQVRERGVIAGTSDKGLGRGKGLLIVGKIIAKYRNVLLNSYFKEDDFVQYLRISKG